MLSYDNTNYSRNLKATFSKANPAWFNKPFADGPIAPCFKKAVVLNCYFKDVKFKNGGHRMACNLDLGIDDKRVSVHMWDAITDPNDITNTWKDQKSRALKDFEYFAHIYAGDDMSIPTVNGDETHYVNVTGMEIYVLIATTGGTKFLSHDIYFFDDLKRSATDLANLDGMEGQDYEKAWEKINYRYDAWYDKNPQLEAPDPYANSPRAQEERMMYSAQTIPDDEIPF